MGLPDTCRIPVSDTKAYKQFGNSVVVPVMRKVARIMAPHIFALQEQEATGQQLLGVCRHMADIVDAATRSRMMSGIRGVNTKPERHIRSLLHRQGFRFRLQVRDLPGRPDIVLPRFHASCLCMGVSGMATPARCTACQTQRLLESENQLQPGQRPLRDCRPCRGRLARCHHLGMCTAGPRRA